MVWPILISVSLAPVSYLPAAITAPADKARVNSTTANNPFVLPLIPFSPATLRPSAAQHVAEQFPTLAVEFLQPHLVHREEAGRARTDPNARQQHGQFHIDVRRLLHQVLAGQLVAALLDRLYEGHGDQIAVHVEDVTEIA